MTTFIVRERGSGQVIASGEEGDAVAVFENSLYFKPEAVIITHLRETERIYTCPYKGVCYWIDLESEAGRAQNIAWVYDNPKPGYEWIAGRIAFYLRETPGTMVERVEDAQAAV